MNPGSLLLLAGISAVVAVIAAFVSRRLWLAVSVAGAAAAFAAAAWVLSTGMTWEWRSNLEIGGQPMHLRLDCLGAFFLALLSLLGAMGSVYAHEYWNDEAHPASAPAGRAWWVALLAAMGLVLIAVNGLHFLIAWELYAVCAYFLITRRRDRRDVRAAGWLYLAVSHVGTLCLFAFFGSLAAVTGGWELGPMLERAELKPLFWLALCGFGLKAGVFPMHIWLPAAHACAPSHVSAILSGMAIKMGIFGLVRFSGWLPVPDAAGWVVAALGVASAVLGVAFALGQHDLKRLLAYHSIENIGIILIGLGAAMIGAAQGHPAWAQLALAGGILHVWNHGLFKALLFLSAGSVLHSTGTREMSRLGGLWRAMPWTTGAFVLGAAAITGLPPLNGFVSEWLVLLGLFDAVAARGASAWAAIPAAALLGITGALALACFVKVCGVVFLGMPRSDVALRAHENGWLMRVPMLVLGAACVAIGIAPALFWPAVARAAAAWQPGLTDGALPPALSTLGMFQVAVASLAALAAFGLWHRIKKNGVSRAVTWDCGYSAPTPRMQYTAGSFAGIITGWFAWILRPERHLRPPEGPFPSHASLEVRTPETVLELVVEPCGAFVMRVSSAIRRLQHGRLQFYILYLLLGVVALSLLALSGVK